MSWHHKEKEIACCKWVAGISQAKLDWVLFCSLNYFQRLFWKLNKIWHTHKFLHTKCRVEIPFCIRIRRKWKEKKKKCIWSIAMMWYPPVWKFCGIQARALDYPEPNESIVWELWTPEIHSWKCTPGNEGRGHTMHTQETSCAVSSPLVNISILRPFSSVRKNGKLLCVCWSGNISALCHLAQSGWYEEPYSLVGCPIFQ